jgi:hypothetical protein
MIICALCDLSHRVRMGRSWEEKQLCLERVSQRFQDPKPIRSVAIGQCPHECA